MAEEPEGGQPARRPAKKGGGGTASKANFNAEANEARSHMLAEQRSRLAMARRDAEHQRQQVTAEAEHKRELEAEKNRHEKAVELDKLKYERRKEASLLVYALIFLAVVSGICLHTAVTSASPEDKRWTTAIVASIVSLVVGYVGGSRSSR